MSQPPGSSVFLPALAGCQRGRVTWSRTALTWSGVLQGSDAEEEVPVPAESSARQQGACGTVQLRIGEAVGLEALTSGCSDCTARAEGDALFLALDGAALRSAPRWVPPVCSAALSRLRGDSFVVLNAALSGQPCKHCLQWIATEALSRPDIG